MKFTEYGLRLREKQKVRRIYGVLEKQFSRYFEKADRARGVTGENLLSLLERRLDSVIYRLGFARTRAEARQLVCHRHFLVNGKRVDIPSFIVKAGDTISLIERSQSKPLFTATFEQMDRRGVPEWLELDREKFTGTVKAMPNREEITLPIQEQLIVEYYSR